MRLPCTTWLSPAPCSADAVRAAALGEFLPVSGWPGMRQGRSAAPSAARQSGAAGGSHLLGAKLGGEQAPLPGVPRGILPDVCRRHG